LTGAVRHFDGVEAFPAREVPGPRRALIAGMDTSRPSVSQQIELPPEEILARLTQGDREQLLDAIVARHFRQQRERIRSWELGC
jgi:hypothetical protein